MQRREFLKTLCGTIVAAAAPIGLLSTTCVTETTTETIDVKGLTALVNKRFMEVYEEIREQLEENLFGPVILGERKHISWTKIEASTRYATNHLT